MPRSEDVGAGNDTRRRPQRRQDHDLKGCRFRLPTHRRCPVGGENGSSVVRGRGAVSSRRKAGRVEGQGPRKGTRFTAGTPSLCDSVRTPQSCFRANPQASFRAGEPLSARKELHQDGSARQRLRRAQRRPRHAKRSRLAQRGKHQSRLVVERTFFKMMWFG